MEYTLYFILGYVMHIFRIVLVILVCRNVPQPLPLVGLHRQPGQSLHAAVDAQTVTHQHIHDPLEGEKRLLQFY